MKRTIILPDESWKVGLQDFATPAIFFALTYFRLQTQKNPKAVYTFVMCIARLHLILNNSDKVGRIEREKWDNCISETLDVLFFKSGRGH